MSVSNEELFYLLFLAWYKSYGKYQKTAIPWLHSHHAPDVGFGANI